MEASRDRFPRSTRTCCSPLPPAIHGRASTHRLRPRRHLPVPNDPAAGVFGLFASGQFESKKVGEEEKNMVVQGDIVINRPVDEVFDFVADERNEPKYN